MTSPHALRIAFMVTEFPALSQTFVLNQITGLIDRGHEVDIFADQPGADKVMHDDVERYGLARRTFYLTKPPRNRALRVLRGAGMLLSNPRALLPALSSAYGLESRSLRLLYAAAAFAPRRDYDIIHAHFGPNGNRAVMLRQAGVLGGRIVTTFHLADLQSGIAGGPDYYLPLRRCGDLIFSISDYNRRHLADFGFDPARILYHPVGISLDEFPFRWDAAAPTGDEPIQILTVARLAEAKGINYGLHAFAELRRRLPGTPLRYTIAGGGPLDSQLKALAMELNLADDVSFIGPVTHDQVVQELSRAHLFFLPSVAEALPVAVMEAQAAGLPVVATDVGSMVELVEDGITGWIVPPKDPLAMADRLAELIAHREQWPDMGRAGRERVAACHDIDKLNDRLVAIYRDLLASPTLPGCC